MTFDIYVCINKGYQNSRGKIPDMTVIEKCELLWKGKHKIKTSSIVKAHPLKVIQSINMLMSKKGWRNKLIVGDNKLIMISLLEEFEEKINTVYIDPNLKWGLQQMKNLFLFG